MYDVLHEVTVRQHPAGVRKEGSLVRGFHAVTGRSPIQFQKRICLQEARLPPANRPSEIAGVGLTVGYDSPSQFSREYRRMFGTPPSQDAARPVSRPTDTMSALP